MVVPGYQWPLPPPLPASASSPEGTQMGAPPDGAGVPDLCGGSSQAPTDVAPAGLPYRAAGLGATEQPSDGGAEA